MKDLIPLIKRFALLAAFYAILAPSIYAQDRIKVSIGPQFSNGRTLSQSARIADYHVYSTIAGGIRYGFNQHDFAVSAQLGAGANVQMGPWEIFGSYSVGNIKGSSRWLRWHGYNLSPLLNIQDSQARSSYRGRLRYRGFGLRLRIAEHTKKQLSLSGYLGAGYESTRFNESKVSKAYAYVCYTDRSYCGIWDNDVTLAVQAASEFVYFTIGGQVRYTLPGYEVTAYTGLRLGRLLERALFEDTDDIKWGPDKHFVYYGAFELEPLGRQFRVYPELSLQCQSTKRFGPFARIELTTEPAVPKFVANAWNTSSLGFERQEMNFTTRLSAGLTFAF